MTIRKLLTRKTFYNLVMFIILTTLTFAILRSIYNQNWLILFTATAVLIITTIPIFLRKKYNTRIPLEIELIAVAFIYASLFLGEIYDFYEIFWWWDILLHAGSAIVFGFVGFSILCLMYSRQEVKTRPIAIAIFSFSFAIAIGAIWEIFEFTMDQFFRLNMQKSGLVDTMWDLIIDTGGAIISSTIAFIYLKTKKTFIFDKIIKRLRKKT